MSDVEKKSETQEAAPKKKPYNLREKKEKKAAYRSLIRAELADELYDKILNIVAVKKKYKDPNYSAKDLANDTCPGYIRVHPGIHTSLPVLFRSSQNNRP